MAIPPHSQYQFQEISHPAATSSSSTSSNQEPVMKSSSAPSDRTIFSGNMSSKKQKTTPPCDRCRQRRIKCDRLQPVCSSCIKYKATCVRTAFPAGAPLSTVSAEAIGAPNLRITTSTKRDRFSTEAEILDSCLRDVHTLQLHRLRKIELFFDRLGIDETRLDEIGWFTEQLKSQRESIDNTSGLNYGGAEVADRLGSRTSVSWIKQVLPLLHATKRVQQIPTNPQSHVKIMPETPAKPIALMGTMAESGHFHCPTPKPTLFPQRVPLSVLNKTMFELSVYDRTEYLGPIAGTRASSWSEEMRFPLPWLVPEPKVPEALLVLPPMEVILELVDWMIKSPLYVYFPILTRASILNALSSALPGPDAPSLGIDKGYGENPSGADNSTDLPQRITGRVSAVFLLNAIMALGAAYRANAIKENKPQSMLRDPKSRDQTFDFQLFFDRSRALTVYILDQPRVSSLQGLLLLMKCPAIPGIQNLYREQACAMALALGLHRDCEPWTLCRSVIQLRRNIFWCCYVIDASYSLNSGSPERFSDDYITLGLPKLPSLEDGDDVGELDAEEETHRIGFLIEQAKLWRIVKKIRRCGQTSNTSSEGASQGANLYRQQDPFSRSRGSDSGLATSSSSPSSGSPQYSGGGYGPLPPSTHSPPSWVWRADSARRILDVELAQWQMELPPRLRFDFALTRKEVPCPFDVRVNGLGAMLQLIFNEVLILLHHPFLLLADSQYLPKPEQSSNPTVIRHSKNRSSTGSLKSPRSRRSSSLSKSAPYFSNNFSSNTNGSNNLSSDGIRKPLPPFLNTCTKAAEAITFLIDHLLKTTPEWLVCHNEAESALHIAERIHVLNISVTSSKNHEDGIGSMMDSCVQQAKVQLRKTRSFRKKIAGLDQFTMSSGWRPELENIETLTRGTARDRLIRSLRQMVVHKRSQNYYRLPRSPADAVTGETPADVLNGGGQDHLEMKLAYLDDRIWLRFYNIRIKDGYESKNGAEGWQEVLRPFVTPSEPEWDLDDIDEDDQRQQQEESMLPFGQPTADELAAALDAIDDDPYSRRRVGSSNGDSMDGVDDQMDPPQSSSSALMELFSYPNPTGIANMPENITGGGSSYYPHHPVYTQRKDYGVVEPGYDTPVYYTGQYAPPDVPLDQFDHIEPPMNLDGPDRHPSGDTFSPDHNSGGYSRQGPQVQPHPPTGYGYQSLQQQQQQQQQQQHSEQHYNYHYQGPARQSHPHHAMEYPSPIPQDHNRTFQPYDLGGGSSVPTSSSTSMGFDHAVTSPPYSTPDSPNQAASTSEAALGLGLLTGSSGPMTTIQNTIEFDGGPYLQLLQQNFPNHCMPTPPQGEASGPMQSLAQQQTFDPNLGVNQQGIRPFYGMPMGGFMNPSLAALPEVRTNPVARHTAAAAANATSYLGPNQSTSAAPVSIVETAIAISSSSSSSATLSKLVSEEKLRSPLDQGSSAPSALDLSAPTSPLAQSTIHMLLSPTAEALQGISNRMNAWEGLPGSQISSPEQTSRQHPLYHQQQAQQHRQSYHQQGPALDYSNAGPTAARFAELMEGVEGDQDPQLHHQQDHRSQHSHQHRTIASAVPEKSPSPYEDPITAGDNNGSSSLQDKTRADEELAALAYQGRPLMSLRGSGVTGRRS